MSQGASLTAAVLPVGMQGQDGQSAASPNVFQDQCAAAAAGQAVQEMSQLASLATIGLPVGMQGQVLAAARAAGPERHQMAAVLPAG